MARIVNWEVKDVDFIFVHTDDNKSYLFNLCIPTDAQKLNRWIKRRPGTPLIAALNSAVFAELNVY
jgi:hypothetical protein